LFHYIFLKLEPALSDADKDGLVKEIGSQIADAMNRNLALKFNNKTGYYRLQRDNEREQLRTSIKRVSPDEPLPDEDDFREPQERVDEIFKELNMFKLAELRTDFKYGLIDDNHIERPLAPEILNDVFDEQVTEKINDIANIRDLLATVH